MIGHNDMDSGQEGAFLMESYSFDMAMLEKVSR